MSFRSKITLTISTLMFLSLTIFGLFSYMDTKKNSVIQTEASLKMASHALTDYIDLWLLNKKSGVESTSKSFRDVEVTALSDIIEKLQDATKILGARDSYVALEDGTMYLGSQSKLPEGYDPRKTLVC